MSLGESKEENKYFNKYIQRIKDRLLKKNQNWLCAICGGTGSGKTYTAISLAIALCKNKFTVKKNMAFTSRQFMQILNSGELESGDYIIFDEAGVGMSSKEWYSIQNKMLSYVLQTFRHRNIGVIFTMPGLKLVDGTARMLFHAYMETITIHRDTNHAQLKVLEFNYDSLQDKIYKKFPVFYDEVGNKITMSNIFVKKAPKKILDEYEAEKQKYTDELNKSIVLSLDELNKPEAPKPQQCPVCQGYYWRFVKKEQCWDCKRCGNKVTSNPFIVSRT